MERGEGLYTVFISYRVASEKCHAALLYEVCSISYSGLNIKNTIKFCIEHYNDQ